VKLKKGIEKKYIICLKTRNDITMNISEFIKLFDETKTEHDKYLPVVEQQRRFQQIDARVREFLSKEDYEFYTNIALNGLPCAQTRKDYRHAKFYPTYLFNLGYRWNSCKYRSSCSLCTNKAKKLGSIQQDHGE
jgi:hypothetical protein